MQLTASGWRARRRDRAPAQLWLGLAALARPGVAASAGIAAGAAALFGGAPLRTALGGGLATLCIAMLTMVVNDIHDLEKDRQSQPRRPLVAGSVSRLEAASWAAVLFATGWILSPLGVTAQPWIVLATLAALLYSPFALRLPMLKGTYTAACCALPLVYGASLAGTQYEWPPLFLAAAFNFGRETFLDAHHARGDAAFGLRTISHVLGVSRARLLGLGVMLATLGVGAVLATWPMPRILALSGLGALLFAIASPRVDDEGIRHWSRAAMAAGGIALASMVPRP